MTILTTMITLIALVIGGGFYYKRRRQDAKPIEASQKKEIYPPEHQEHTDLNDALDTVIVVGPPPTIIKYNEEPMASFEIAYKTIARNEGGYQKFSDDPGNYNSLGQLVGTNWGINAKVYSDYLGRPATQSEMRNMSKAVAKDIYKQKYWKGIRGNSIQDQQVATILFDGHVNHGRWGIKMIQEVLGVTKDGSIGPVTLNAINDANSLRLFNLYKERRKKFYNWYATVKRPEMKDRWLSPWLSRMDAFVYQGGPNFSEQKRMAILPLAFAAYFLLA